MPLDSLRPTAAIERTPTLEDGALAFDGSDATFALVKTANPSSSARADFVAFPPGTVDPSARTSATLRLRGQWATPDILDALFVAISNDGGATFQLFASIPARTVFPSNPTPSAEIDFDVAALIGSAPASALRVRFQFANNVFGDDPLPPILVGD
jgi:hypothetical protein